MTKLLMEIDRRTRYLARAFPQQPTRNPGAMVKAELPSEPWAECYQGITIPISVLPNIEKIYGAEAAARNESVITTMLRYAATPGGARQ